MSINWVMLSPSQAFVPLQNERTLVQSPPRISFTLHSLNKYPGREPFSASSNSGVVHLTNRRASIIYLPDSKTSELQSFAAPLLNFHDSHVTTPWFGPNAWTAVVQPVLNGGIPSHIPAVEIKLTFKDGGAYDFHNEFVRVKERASQAAQLARDRNPETAGTSSGAVNWDSVHLDDLPAYEETSSTTAVSTATDPSIATQTSTTRPEATQTPSSGAQAPAEPPPGYEETQRDTVAEHLERELRLS